MPGPIHDHDPDIVLEAERDIRTKLGDRALDFDAMLAVSNIYRAATAVRNRMEKEVLTPAGLTTVWWRREHATAHRRAAAALERGGVPALQQFLEPCTALTERELVIVTARCIIDRAGGGDPR